MTSIAIVTLGDSKLSKSNKPEEQRVSSTHVMASLTVATPTPQSKARRS